MRIKKFDGRHRGSFVRDVVGVDDTGKIIVELVFHKKASRQLRQEINHRGKEMSGLIAGGKSADHFSPCRGSLKSARQIAHKKDRQYFGRVLREVVQAILNGDDNLVRETLPQRLRAAKRARYRANVRHRNHCDIADSRAVTIDGNGHIKALV